MTERATIAQVAQFGVETTPGTAVPATVRLSTLLLTRGVKSTKQVFRGSGFKYPAVTAIGKEWEELAVSGPMTYTEMIYALASVMTTTTAAAVSTATTAKKWTFQPSSTAPDVSQTYTIESGSSVRADSVAGAFFDQFGFTFDRDTVNMTGHMMARQLQDGATLSTGAQALAIQPVLSDQLSVYLDTTASGLGGTKLTRVLSGAVSLQNRFGPVWAVDAAQTSYVATVETEPTATIDLMVEADSQGMGLLPYLRNDQSAFLRVEAIGPIANAAEHYRFTWDAAVKVIGNDDFGDAQGVEAINWHLQIVHDATWTRAYQAEVVNMQTTL